MKKILGLLSVCLPVCLMLIGRMGKSPERGKLFQKTSAESVLPVPSLTKKDQPAPSVLPEDLKREIVQLTEQVKDIEHALATRGFPKVMREKRLSERERQEIIELSNRQSRLFAQLVRLRLRAINEGELQ